MIDVFVFFQGWVIYSLFFGGYDIYDEHSLGWDMCVMSTVPMISLYCTFL